jgi:hypothetical protein
MPLKAMKRFRRGDLVEYRAEMPCFKELTGGIGVVTSNEPISKENGRFWHVTWISGHKGLPLTPCKGNLLKKIGVTETSSD